MCQALCATLEVLGVKDMGTLLKRLSRGLRSSDTSVGNAGRKLAGRQAQIDAAVVKATASADTTPPKRKKFKSFQKPRF